MSAGVAGKDIRVVHEVWPETAIRLSHRNWAFVIKSGGQPEGIRAGCSGWKTCQWTSLAVQQQRFEPDSNAD
jgi:hypothetical protein